MDRLVLALTALKYALLVGLALGLAIRGPRRWVKYGLAVLVANELVLRDLEGGWQSALSILVVGAVVVCALQYHVLRSWRAPRRQPIVAGGPVAWPSHAKTEIERWTRDLVALGFEAAPDAGYSWTINGARRTTYLRLFRHRTEPCWASLSASPSPKSIGRTMNTQLADGRRLQTGDRMLDTEMFPDPIVVTQHASGASCERLFDVHRARLASLEPTRADPFRAAVPIADPIEAHRSARDAWIESLLAHGKMRVEGENVALASRTALRGMLRAFAKWFA